MLVTWYFFKGLYILCRGLNDIDVVHGDENESNVAVFVCGCKGHLLRPCLKSRAY